MAQFSKTALPPKFSVVTTGWAMGQKTELYLKVYNSCNVVTYIKIFSIFSGVK